MNFLRRVRYFSTSDVKTPSPASYFKEHAQSILSAVTISAGIFAAGAYSVQTGAEIKVLKAKIHDQSIIYEERIKTTEERIKTTEERIKTTEEKGRIALEGQINTAEERIKATEERIKTTEEKGRIALEGQIKTTEEKIKTAKEEAKKEALERLFNVINQAEYDSAKKAIQEIPIQKNIVK